VSELVLLAGDPARFIRENADVAGYNLIKDPSDSSSTATTGSVSKERWYTDSRDDTPESWRHRCQA
jgi:hypothetical protein